MSFMKQLEEYKEFSDNRRGDDRSRSHSSGHSDDHTDERKKRRSGRSRRRSRSSSNSRDRSPRRRRSHSSDESDQELDMERCISDKPTPVILARGITEYMTESILRDAIISSGNYPRDIHFARKRRSGHVRGWGFVEFYNEEDARRWLESFQGTFYMGEEGLSLLYCVPSASPFYEQSGDNNGRADEWNCARCGKLNSWRDHDICFRCGCNRRDDSSSERRRSAPVEKPNFDRVGRAPCNTILIRELDTVTISERSIKTALYDQQRIASSSIRSCFIVRNPPVTETTKSASCCYAFVELSSTHEATQLVDRMESKPLMVEGRAVKVSFARYPFTTIMASIHQWLSSASETSNPETAGATAYAPTQTDVTNAAAAVAQAAMMARQQAGIERAKRRAKRQARREREREGGESSRRSSSGSTYSSDDEDGSRSSPSPHSSQLSAAAAAAAASSSVNRQYGFAPAGLPSAFATGASFQFDSASGYYYDASTGSYFDPKTRYFYSPNLAQWLMWDNATNQYVPVPSQNATGQDSNANKQQLEGSSGLTETDEMKKEREKREKAKEARRVQKEMEKWAANQNNDKAGGTAGSVTAKRIQPQAAPSTSQQPTSAGGPASGSTADAVFAFMQTSTSTESDQSSLLESSVTHLMSLLDWQSFICKVCSRKLSTEEQLRKHCAQSELHKTNASRWCQDQGLSSNMATLVIDTIAKTLINQEPAAPAPASVETKQAQQVDTYVYRDRAKERRQKSYGGSSRGQDDSSSSYSYTAPAVSLDQPVEGLGRKLMEKIGWEGKGLGRHGQGRLDPIEAERRDGRAGLGLGGSTRASTDHLDYREAAKRTLFSRFNELR